MSERNTKISNQWYGESRSQGSSGSAPSLAELFHSPHLAFDTEIYFSTHKKWLGKSSYIAYFLADVYNQIFVPKSPYIETLVLSLWKSGGRECFTLKKSRPNTLSNTVERSLSGNPWNHLFYLTLWRWEQFILCLGRKRDDWGLKNWRSKK